MINNICAVCKNDSAVLIGDTYYCDKCGAEYPKEETKTFGLIKPDDLLQEHLKEKE